MRIDKATKTGRSQPVRPSPHTRPSEGLRRLFLTNKGWNKLLADTNSKNSPFDTFSLAGYSWRWLYKGLFWNPFCLVVARIIPNGLSPIEFRITSVTTIIVIWKWNVSILCIFNYNLNVLIIIVMISFSI